MPAAGPSDSDRLSTEYTIFGRPWHRWHRAGSPCRAGKDCLRSPGHPVLVVAHGSSSKNLSTWTCRPPWATGRRYPSRCGSPGSPPTPEERDGSLLGLLVLIDVGLIDLFSLDLARPALDGRVGSPPPPAGLGDLRGGVSSSSSTSGLTRRLRVGRAVAISCALVALVDALPRLHHLDGDVGVLVHMIRVCPRIPLRRNTSTADSMYSAVYRRRPATFSPWTTMLLGSR